MNPKNNSKETDKKFLKSQKNILDSFLREKEKMIFENNSYTQWFKEMILDNDLLGYFEKCLPEFSDYLFKRMIRDCIHYECKKDIQYLYIDYLAPISLDNVLFKERTENRTEKISKWGNYYSLNRIYYDYSNQKALNINTLPVVKREYDLEKKNNKFILGDGNHRFFFAKKNNIPTVMCLVHDSFIIRKAWVEKNLERIINEKEEDLKNKGATLII